MNNRLTKQIFTSTKRKRNLESIGLGALNVVKNNYFSDFSDFNIEKDIQKTTSWKRLGYCRTSYRKIITLGIHSRLLTSLGDFYTNFNIEKLEINSENKVISNAIKSKHQSILNNSIKAYKVFFHEMYHTRNKINIPWLEESITEINSHLYFKKYFSNITGLNLKDLEKYTYVNDFKQLSYVRYIDDLLVFFQTIGLKEKETFKIIKDIKNFDKSENISKSSHLETLENLIDFMLFIDVYYNKKTIQKLFGKKYSTSTNRDFLSTIVYDNKFHNKKLAILKDLMFNKETKRRYYTFKTDYIKSPQYKKDKELYSNTELRDLEKQSLIDTIYKYSV